MGIGAEASKVIRIRNVGDAVTEADLVELVKPFGAVARIHMVHARNQAFLQMEEMEAAASAMDHYARVQANVKGMDVYLGFSPHQEILKPNRILFVSIHKRTYPTGIEVLHQVFSPYGFVEKIAIFEKFAGFHALVQYESLESAIEAKDTLHERNIYEGCCQLEIQFSNRTELQVYNNDTSRDFSNPSLHSDRKSNSSLLGKPVPIAAAFGGDLPPGITGTNGKCTIYAVNLEPAKIDERKLFNLFSLYGNIVRIKILHKRDHALIEMADGFQAELAVHFLKGAILFGKQLDVTFSKFAHVTASPHTHEFAGSNLNRFNSSTVKNYKYCCAPTKMIYVSSLPQEITEDEMVAHMEEESGAIVNIKIFKVSGKKQALILFDDEEHATETLVCKNGTKIGQSTILLSFSQHLSVD